MVALVSLCSLVMCSFGLCSPDLCPIAKAIHFSGTLSWVRSPLVLLFIFLLIFTNNLYFIAFVYTKSWRNGTTVEMVFRVPVSAGVHSVYPPLVMVGPKGGLCLIDSFTDDSTGRERALRSGLTRIGVMHLHEGIVGMGLECPGGAPQTCALNWTTIFQCLLIYNYRRGYDLWFTPFGLCSGLSLSTRALRALDSTHIYGLIIDNERTERRIRVRDTKTDIILNGMKKNKFQRKLNIENQLMVRSGNGCH